MAMTLKHFFTLILAGALIFSCSKPEDEKTSDSFDISGISLPASIEAKAEEPVKITAPAGKILTSDIVTFNAVAGSGSYDCTIISSDETGFTFKLNAGITSGRYVMHIRRGDADKTVGVTNIRILSAFEIDSEGASVYGFISCDGTGVPDVVVTDGFVFTTTDKNGVYHLDSKKDLGYVSMSLPAGYEPEANGFLPRIHNALTEKPTVPERSDFTLHKVSNDKFNLIVMGDMHLANRNNDRKEFYKFTADVRDFLKAHTGEVNYGLTLGDMTWDLYWYSNSYYFPQYIADMNSTVNGVDGLMTFHTIGNHDHDMNAAGDLDTEVKYVKDIAPTYYSFNLGKVHFIVLDNILCTNSGAGTADSRTYKAQLDADQLAWLKKDISYIDHSTPLIISMHAPVFYDNANNSSIASVLQSQYSTMLAALNGFDAVHILTGHTHRILNTDRTSSANYYEHNAGAVCASWWWTEKLTQTNVGTDGAPGGYEIWEIDGKNFKWQFIGTKESADYQFRTYDLNNVEFPASTVSTYLPSGSEWAKGRLQELYSSRFPKRSDNKVLINVWNYNPSWTLKVMEKTSEGDKELTVKQVKNYDPLHILALDVPRLNANISSDPSFLSVLTTHMFEVTASAAGTTLEITATDEFGNVSTQTMTRPKDFNLNTYRTNYYKTY